MQEFGIWTQRKRLSFRICYMSASTSKKKEIDTMKVIKQITNLVNLQGLYQA